MIVCDGCGDGRELDPARCSPGVRTYKPCARCGAIGIRDTEDRYQERQERRRKKANTAPYEASPYRGGKLQVLKGDSGPAKSE